MSIDIEPDLTHDNNTRLGTTQSQRESTQGVSAKAPPSECRYSADIYFMNHQHARHRPYSKIKVEKNNS